MKKRIKNFLVCALTIVTVLETQLSSYAQTQIALNEVQNIETVNNFSNGKLTRAVGITRGRLLSSAALEILDKGKGTIGVSSDILCHEPMERITAWIYLEKWDPVEEDWTTVQYEQFEWLASDYPDENLTMAMISYNIPNQERGRDYRLRGLFGAKDLDSQLQETWTVATASLFLE